MQAKFLQCAHGHLPVDIVVFHHKGTCVQAKKMLFFAGGVSCHHSLGGRPAGYHFD
jgi:hypothetical protein